ncbi:MAG: hypothetical protein IT348_20245 [Candidatus Eisenbacteria bacterium]|nr:hypothetical protein [Candidatus Eisenbacteria bacterium]
MARLAWLLGIGVGLASCGRAAGTPTTPRSDCTRDDGLPDASDSGARDAGAGAEAAADGAVADASVALIAQLDRAPPSRVVCTFHTTKHAIKPQIEFPALSAEGLVQSLRLDGPAQVWKVLCAMEPVKGDAGAIGHLFPDAAPHIALGMDAGDSAQLKIGDSSWSVTIRQEGSPSTASTGPKRAERADLRSLDAVGDVVGELGKIVAEIAVSRARVAALNVVRKRLLDACDSGAKECLPETCTAIRALRIQDLTGALPTLRDALVADLVQRAVMHLQNVEVVKFMSEVLLAAARHGEVEADPHALARAARNSNLRKPVAEAVDLVEICMQTAYSCTVEETWQVIVANKVQLTADERAAVEALIGALRASSEEPARKRVLRTVDAAFALIALQNGSARLTDVRLLASALIRNDLPKVIAVGSRFLGDSSSTNLTRVAGTVAAYAATFETPAKTGEERKQRYEARKELVSDLIDSLTDRAERGGEFIVSVGSVPGLMIGGQKTKDADWQLPPPQLALPTGLALQLLPTDTGPGLHLAFSGLDLAQFAATDNDGQLSDPSWASALTVALQAGFLIGQPSSSFFVGADARYSPGILAPSGDPTKSGGGAYRVGLLVGYYVPLLDLN